MVFLVVGFDIGNEVFMVEYWDGIQYVVRVARCIHPGCFMVFDRYDDGTECMIRRYGLNTYSQAECVRLLDEVCY